MPQETLALEPQHTHDAMDGAFGTFPDYMVLVPDVFMFSYKDIAPAMARFRRNSDLLAAIDHTIMTVQGSDVSEEDKAQIVELLEQEKDVITYSIVSKSSVVTI